MMGMMNEDQALFMVKMIASELGYMVKWVRASNMIENDILVIENGYDDQYHSFVGENKFEIALEWLRRRIESLEACSTKRDFSKSMRYVILHVS